MQIRSHAGFCHTHRVPATDQRVACRWTIAALVMTRLAVVGASAWLFSTSSALGEVIVDWSFNQSSGSVAIDSGPNRIDGALAGNATWASGFGQNAIDVTGDGFVNFTQSGIPKVPSVIRNLAEGSIGVRFFVDSYPADQAAQPILPIFWMGRNFGGIGQYGLTIEIGHAPPYKPFDHAIYFTILDVAELPIFCFNSSQDITPGAWHTFVAVVGGTGNTGYLNGVEMTDRHYNFGNSSSTAFFSSVTPPSDALWVGKGFYAQETGAMHFNGLIQNLRIFDQPLTSQQVAELYAVPEIHPTHLGGILSLVFGTLAIVERRSRPSRGSVSG
jgi:Concanavalin A-like lectin/glucanases superfamily